MYREIEDTLAQELRVVAEGIDVPALPAMPSSQTSSRFGWSTLLVAAAVVLIALAATVTLLNLGPDRSVQPAPAPTPTEATEEVSTAAPEVPYIVGDRLFVEGRRVPGSWYVVDGTSTGWIGVRVDDSYGWGYDAEPKNIEGQMNQPPVISPGGKNVAMVLVEQGQGMLTGFDTRPAGEGFGGVDIPALVQGSYSRAVAVTDEGLVVGSGADFQEVWRPLVDGGVVQLSDTAPGQVVLGNTAAGLIVVEGRYDSADGTQGQPYLADLSEDGILTRLQDLPTHDVLDASEEWVAWIEPGSLGGETSATDRLQVQRIDGSDAAELLAPDGYAFLGTSLQWETADRLLAAVTGSKGDRMVRCSPVTQECVLLDTP